MKQIIKMIELSLIGALIWCILNERFNFQTFITGMILGYLSIYICKISLEDSYFKFKKTNLLVYAVKVIFNIYKSSFKCIKAIILNKGKVKVFTYESELQESWDQVVIANSITLMPGTITISLENNKYKVIALDFIDSASNWEEKMIENFEKTLVKEVVK